MVIFLSERGESLKGVGMSEEDGEWKRSPVGIRGRSERVYLVSRTGR